MMKVRFKCSVSHIKKCVYCGQPSGQFEVCANCAEQLGMSTMQIKCPLCGTILRIGNEGPFCTRTECRHAQFALQAYLAQELEGRTLNTVRIDDLQQEKDGIYRVWCEYEGKRGAPVRLEGARFNEDGVGVGQRVSLRMKEPEPDEN